MSHTSARAPAPGKSSTKAPKTMETTPARPSSHSPRISLRSRNAIDSSSTPLRMAFTPMISTSSSAVRPGWTRASTPAAMLPSPSANHSHQPFSPRFFSADTMAAAPLTTAYAANSAASMSRVRPGKARASTPKSSAHSPCSANAHHDIDKSLSISASLLHREQLRLRRGKLLVAERAGGVQIGELLQAFHHVRLVPGRLRFLLPTLALRHAPRNRRGGSGDQRGASGRAGRVAGDAESPSADHDGLSKASRGAGYWPLDPSPNPDMAHKCNSGAGVRRGDFQDQATAEP